MNALLQIPENEYPIILVAIEKSVKLYSSRILSINDLVFSYKDDDFSVTVIDNKLAFISLCCQASEDDCFIFESKTSDDLKEVIESLPPQIYVGY